MFFQFVDNRAIRTSQWTMAEVDNAGWELIRIREDPLETRDLSSKFPEIVDSLNTTWLAWWKSQTGEPDYVPKSTSLHFTGAPFHFEEEDSATIKIVFGNKLFALSSTEKPPQL